MPSLTMNPPIARAVASSPPPASGSSQTSVPQGPLTEEHYEALRRARLLREPVRVAARWARISAISILAMAALSLPFLIVSPSLMGGYILAGLSLIGIWEYMGARRMGRGEPGAALFLARNQLIFLAIVCAYCVVQMLSFSADTAVSPELKAQLSAVPELQQEVERMSRELLPLLSYGLYSLVILASVLFQGGLAYYYYTRKAHLDALERSTPPWITRLFNEIET